MQISPAAQLREMNILACSLTALSSSSPTGSEEVDGSGPCVKVDNVHCSSVNSLAGEEFHLIAIFCIYIPLSLLVGTKPFLM